MFLVASWNPSSCLLLLLDMSFRFCLCGMYLSLRDAFKVRECPGFLLTWEVWAIEPSGISEYKAAVPPAGAVPGFLEGWLTTAQGRAGVDSVQRDPGPVMGGQTSPGTDWSQRTSRGLGTRGQCQHLHSSSCALSTDPAFRPLGFPLGTAVPKWLHLARGSKESESFPGILSLAALNSLWSPA